MTCCPHCKNEVPMGYFRPDEMPSLLPMVCINCAGIAMITGGEDVRLLTPSEEIDLGADNNIRYLREVVKRDLARRKAVLN